MIYKFNAVCRLKLIQPIKVAGNDLSEALHNAQQSLADLPWGDVQCEHEVRLEKIEIEGFESACVEEEEKGNE